MISTEMGKIEAAVVYLDVLDMKRLWSQLYRKGTQDRLQSWDQ